MEGVRIFPNITGASGQYAQWKQLSSFTGPTGTFKNVYPVSAPTFAAAPTGTFKTVIIPGYVGPS